LAANQQREGDRGMVRDGPELERGGPSL